jgi:hypothetical protein
LKARWKHETILLKYTIRKEGKNMKRFIAIFMMLCVILGMSSVSAWADDEILEWKDEPSMPQGAIQFGSCVVGDNIYVLGSSNSNTVEIYNTKSQTWKIGTSMPQSTLTTNAVVLENKIYAIGSKGTNIYTDFTTVMQIYDLTTEKWTVKTDVLFFARTFCNEMQCKSVTPQMRFTC